MPRFFEPNIIEYPAFCNAGFLCKKLQKNANKKIDMHAFLVYNIDTERRVNGIVFK